MGDGRWGGMIDANTISHDHAVITLPSCARRLAAELSQSNGAIGQKAVGGRGRGRGLSDPRRRLAVVVGGLHLEDVGDDAVDLHVADEAGEEELLGDGGADQPEGRETQQQLGQPDRQRKGCRVGGGG